MKKPNTTNPLKESVRVKPHWLSTPLISPWALEKMEQILGPDIFADNEDKPSEQEKERPDNEQN